MILRHKFAHFCIVNLHLLPASEKDISTIQALAHEIWNDHYPAIIGQEQVDYMLNSMYAAESMLKQMETGQQFFLLLQDETPIGFASVENKAQGQYFLNKCYIKTDRQRTGAGSYVINAVLAHYADCRELRLQVNRQNYKAINFYFKMGFVIEQVADFDIGDGYFMNDFIMLLKR
jgi:ribosomal protein S18 acetylase RimI-like enzyme